MTVNTATEQAYRNGYEAGKRDAVVHCKDCIWENRCEVEDLIRNYSHNEEAYCSDGERRT